ARHDGVRRRAEFALQRRLQAGVPGQERRQRRKPHPGQAPPRSSRQLPRRGSWQGHDSPLQRRSRRRHHGCHQAGRGIVPAEEDDDLGREKRKGGELIVPKPATILPDEVDKLRKAWARNSLDLGLGLYKPSSGEIHIGSYDDTGQLGHDGLAALLAITDDAEWRGFAVWPDGAWLPVSRFNQPDGGLRMAPDSAAEVEQALRRAGLIP